MALDNYRILVENEVSAWNDETGVKYHFPRNRYLNRLWPGMKIIYYRGRTKGKQPQYFGSGEINRIYPDPESKNDYYADIVNYNKFEQPVSFKQDGEYLEEITTSNHFRQNSVRPISEERFYKILELGGLNPTKIGTTNDSILAAELLLFLK